MGKFRRSLFDDALGLEEALNETPFAPGIGLEVVGRHWIKIGDKEVKLDFQYPRRC